jgi:integrase
MHGVLKTGGNKPLSSITGSAIKQGIDRRKPFAARHFVDTMRGLYKWAVAAEHVTSDPTAGKAVAKPKTKGFPVWTEEDLERFERRWPIGTRERVMFDVYLYTGLRRGDAAKLGKQHIRNGVITIDTEKSKGQMRVTIPVLPELAETIAAGPTGELSIIASKKGQPIRKEVLGNLFKKACRAAGINKSAHGIRKAAATRAANNGATVAALEAIFGWEGGQMASLYTRAADRRALAAEHMVKLSKTGTSIPAPHGKVRGKAKKG